MLKGHALNLMTLGFSRGECQRRLYPYMRESKRETFVELSLDTKNQVIREDTISIG
jgi:DNA repair protein RadC